MFALAEDMLAGLSGPRFPPWLHERTHLGRGWCKMHSPQVLPRARLHRCIKQKTYNHETNSRMLTNVCVQTSPLTFMSRRSPPLGHPYLQILHTHIRFMNSFREYSSFLVCTRSWPTYMFVQF